MDVGGRIIELRTARGWSKKQLAERAGISQASLHYIECNENSPTVNTLKKIATALGVTVQELLGGTDDLPPTGTDS